MSEQPDLQGLILGLKKASPDSPCFDPDQPWWVNFAIINKGKGSAGTFSVTFETYEPVVGFEFKTIASQTKTFTMPEAMDFKLGPGQSASADWQLPVGVAHTDFGKKNPFAFIIDPGNEIDESIENNNSTVTMKMPPIIKKPSPESPSPPSPWKMDASAVIGKHNAVVATISNQSSEKLSSSTLELVLRASRPGAPTGNPMVAGTAKIPALKPWRSRVG